MNLFEHPGPKGQIFVDGRKDPLWFSSARDTIAFVRLPEQPETVVVAYVNDMGRAVHWDHPDAGAWVKASDAWYAIGSRRTGGMGADEAVPFAAEDKAKAFAAQFGGRVVSFVGIPQGYVLGSGETSGTMAGMELSGRLVAQDVRNGRRTMSGVKIGRRRFLTIAAASAGMTIVLGRGRAAEGSEGHTLRRWRGTALGADAELVFHHSDPAEAERLLGVALGEIERLEQVFSLYRPELRAFPPQRRRPACRPALRSRAAPRRRP